VIIIDGYNLLRQTQGLYAELNEELSSAGLCQVLSSWASKCGREVLVIFDGYPPADFAATYSKRFDRLEIIFSRSNKTADQVICEHVKSSSSPRRLIVVSSDNQIRRVAARRRCKLLRSLEFWQQVCKELSRPSRPKEPSEKRTGLDAGQVDYWLEQFGID